MYSMRFQLARDGNFSYVPLDFARELPFSEKAIVGNRNSIGSSPSL